MRRRLLDGLAELVVDRRTLVLAGLGLLTLAFGALIPTIEADSSPEGLVSTFGDQARALRLLKASFGNTDNVVALVVLADDVVTPPCLAYVRDAARHFEAEPWVEQVASIATTAIATRGAASPEDEDELDLDELEALEADGEGSDDMPADVLAALTVLVEEGPERWPDGLASLSDATASIDDRVRVGDEGPVTEAMAHDLREALGASPLLDGVLFSRDRTVTQVAIVLDRDMVRHDDVHAAVAAVDAWAGAHPPPPGVQLRVAGIPHLRASIVTKMMQDQVVLVPLTLLVCVVLLYLSFRWIPGMLLPIGAVAISAVLTIGAMAAAGEQLNILNNILPPLLIIIGISDSIHLIGRYREEIGRARDRQTAAKATLRSMAIACFLTSFTTAVGLGSLVVSHTDMLARFGVTAAIGVMIAYVVTVLFLPAAIVFFEPPESVQKAHAAHHDRIEQSVVTLTRVVIRRPWVVLGVSFVLVGGAAASATRVRVDSSLLDQFDETDPLYATTRLLEEKLDGVRPIEVLLVATDARTFARPDVLAGMDAVAVHLEGRRGVARATSPSDLLHESAYLLSGDEQARSGPFRSVRETEALAVLVRSRQVDALGQYLSNDGKIARLEIRMNDIGAQATRALVADLDRQLAEHLPRDAHIEVLMTGDGYSGAVGIAAVVDDLLGSLSLAVLIIFGVLAVLFRSVRLGLLSIPPNIIPLVLTVAWMVVRDIPLSIATAIIFSISLGLAVDGTIHVLARFREEQHGGRSLDDALIRAARGTGRAIVVSSVTLLLGFSVLLLSGFVPVRYFGELIAVTIASCVVATLVVQPALLKVGAKGA